MRNWYLLSAVTWLVLSVVPGKANAEPTHPVAVAQQFLTALANKDATRVLEGSTTPFVFWTTGKKKDCEGSAADSSQMQKKLTCILSSKVHAKSKSSFLAVLAKAAPNFNLGVELGKNLYTGPATQMKGYQDLKRKAVELEPGHSLVKGTAEFSREFGGNHYEIVLLVGTGHGKPMVTGLLIDFEIED